MLERLIEIDKQVLVFLNRLGSSTYDPLWLYITKQAYWTPFFLLLFYLLQKKIGWKHLGIVILFIALLMFVGNESVEFCKETVQRLRPVNEPSIHALMRVERPYSSDTYSFFSGHAANSISAMTFVFMILRRYYKYAALVFLYPLIFAYSRIYLGAHYPSDILTGYLFGCTLGFLFHKLYEYFLIRFRL